MTCYCINIEDINYEYFHMFNETNGSFRISISTAKTEITWQKPIKTTKIIPNSHMHRNIIIEGSSLNEYKPMLKAFLPNLPSITKKHTVNKVIKTNPKHLFNIINDVNQYSNFLPLCAHSKILQKSKCGTMYDATLTIGFGSLFTEQYISRVKVDNRNMIVTTNSIQSKLFDSLKSKWKLSDHVSSSALISRDNNNEKKEDIWCNVQFEVEISVNDPIISNVLDTVLSDVAKKQVEAFQQRCHEVPRS